LEGKPTLLVGDSKVIIDWIKEEVNLNILHLGPWKEKMWRLKDSFERLKFMHVHRIYNTIVDQLCKIAMNRSCGWIYFQKLVESYPLLWGHISPLLQSYFPSCGVISPIHFSFSFTSHGVFFYYHSLYNPMHPVYTQYWIEDQN